MRHDPLGLAIFLDFLQVEQCHQQMGIIVLI